MKTKTILKGITTLYTIIVLTGMILLLINLIF